MSSSEVFKVHRQASFYKFLSTDVIRFDNSAMLKSKTLSYLIEILEPDDEDLFEIPADDN